MSLQSSVPPVNFTIQDACYSLKIHPSSSSNSVTIACSTAENFGVRGRGKVIILTLSSGPNFLPHNSQINTVLQWPDAIFDLSFNQAIADENSSKFVFVTGDGHLGLSQDAPINSSVSPSSAKKLHNGEINCVEWVDSNIYTASWDRYAKVIDINRAFLNTGLDMSSVICEWKHSSGIVYQNKPHPNMNYLFSTCCGDGMTRIFDIRSPIHRPQTLLGMANQQTPLEVLCCAWCPNPDWLLLCGNTMGRIFGWDLRFPDRNQPLLSFTGHTRAVRRIVVNPNAMEFFSCGYDTMVMQWTMSSYEPQNSWKLHSEFVYGLDAIWRQQDEAVICAHGGWDRRLFCHVNQTHSTLQLIP